MDFITILIGMRLRGQAELRAGERGYAMAALLVAMSIMAVMMTVAMPVWKHQVQREREEELVFRGMQYVHAIALFQRKLPNAYPPNVDVLVDQRFLRKKYKDPITNDDFALLPGGTGTTAPGQTAPPGGPGSGPGAGRGGGTTTAPQPTRGTTVAAQPTQSQPQSQTGGALRGVSPIGTPGAGGGTTAGVGGVASKSKATSIRLYNGRSHYNEWAFVYQPQVQQAGQGGAPGTAQPGQVGPPGQRGGPGFPPGGGGNRGRGGPFDGPGRGGGRGGGPGQQMPIQPPPRGRE
jgi:type II secretory pathway pseudopilin PulG